MRTIRDAAAALAQGETTSAALTEAALARAQDPTGEGRRIFTRLFPESARAEAAASDRLRAAGVVPSALAGIPVSVKDLLDMRGYATTAGAVALRDAPPAAADSAVVARLRAAGAVITGRTNMPEFASSGVGLNPGFGTPRNPWDRATGRSPGGSSSGAGVAVADDMSFMSIGSDTAGSIRIPAALNGVTGFKPTQRRVPLAGCHPLSNSLDSLGPLARSVACCALADGILASEDSGVPAPIPLDRVTFGVPRRSYLLDDLEPAVAAAFEQSLSRLSAAGARILDVEVPALTPDRSGLLALVALISPESHAYNWHLVEGRVGEFDPRIAGQLEAGGRIPGSAYVKALEARRVLIAEVRAALAGIRVWLAPTVPCLAPPIAEIDASDEAYGLGNLRAARNTACVNLLDGCALSLPCHEPGTGPVGLMLVGDTGTDRSLLAIGLSVEAALAG